MAVSNPFVELVRVTPSEGGLTAYLHSLASKTVETEIAFPNLRARALKLGNHLGRHMENIALTENRASISLTPGAYVSLAIDLEPR
jgi:hypothetical protein